MGLIILDISNKSLLDGINGLDEREEVLGRLETWHYESLKRAFENKMIPRASGNKYVLVKLPINEVPNSILTIFYELQLRGYVPIIAQAERNNLLRHSPNVLYTFVKRGALVQINASSLTGRNGRALRSFALKLCKHNLVHLVYPDTPDLENSPVALRSAYGYLQKKLSFDYVKVFRENAKHILSGTDFQVLPPIRFR